MLKVSKVKRNSIASDFGIQVNDQIIAFDYHNAEDELDYLYYCTLSHFILTVKDEHSQADFTVDKEEDEDLGLEFYPNEKIKTCYNHCVFCFVDQMPKGMRESLYIKDDDYGMSFSCGNFVTLTNISDEQIERIIRLKLSPLYVSVQTMNPTLRCELLHNRFAGKIGEQIKKLAEGGIKLHCQAVIVPDVSDGKELEYTARQLFEYYPQVEDLAVVPTGITKFRKGLYPIQDITAKSAGEVLELCDKLNEEFKVNFLLPADEYFIRSGKKLKEAEFYGDFEQLENGIGMTTHFLNGFYSALRKETLKKPKRSLVICGTSAKGIMDEVCKKAEENIQGLSARALSIENKFFGATVTCTGLLTGQDILPALEKEKGTFDEVILPSNVFKEFTDIFLDGETLRGLKKKLKFKNILVNENDGEGLFELFIQ